MQRRSLWKRLLQGSWLLAGLLFGSLFNPLPTQALSGASPSEPVVPIATFADDGEQLVNVIQGNDGMLYVTCNNGGAQGKGAIFKMRTDGSGLTVIHSFSGSDGQSPNALIQGNDGALYGTAAQGGSGSAGTIFRMNTDGTGFTVLYNFSAPNSNEQNADGAYPVAGLVQDSRGVLYGTTSSGGTNGDGVVFKIDPHTANSYTVLHTFSGNDGAAPQTSLTLMGSTLYGTTAGGTTSGAGEIFSINTDATNFQILYAFTGGIDGSDPASPLLAGPNGVLYGTTYSGGYNGNGVIFQIDTNNNAFSVLYTFSAGQTNGDGASPIGSLALDSAGRLYGTTSFGGTNGNGTAYLFDPNTGAFVPLHDFGGSNDGRDPFGGVLLGMDGNLYGTTRFGGLGDNNGGTVYSITVGFDENGNLVTNEYNLRYISGENNNGRFPFGGVIQGKDGMLYGTTYSGGRYGDGTVFKVSPDGSNFQVLHDFSGTDGAFPAAGLCLGSDGALYGTTNMGGQFGKGVIFKIYPDGSGFTVLHDFTALDPSGHNSDGASPVSPLVQGNDNLFSGSGSYLFGVAGGGGSNGSGVIFRIRLDGTDFSVIHNFAYADGSGPYGGLIQGQDGALYGTTPYGGANADGVVYRVNPDGSYFNVLHSFDGSDGALPDGNLVQLPDGTLCGTTAYGGGNHTGYNIGAVDDGVVFSLQPTVTNSQFTVIYNFNQNSGANGANPFGGLVWYKGYLYDATTAGGSNNDGVIFRVAPSGASFAKLHDFSGPDGVMPFLSNPGFLVGKDGELYGTVAFGGTQSNGAVYRIGPQVLFLNPNIAPANTTNLTINVFGSGFNPLDTVLWNGQSLPTTYVSSNQLQATLSNTGGQGSDKVQVYDPVLGVTTPPLLVLVGVAQLHLQVISIIRDAGGQVEIALSFTNTGGASLSNLTINSAKLHGSPAISGTGIVGNGNLSPGQSISVTLVFPASVPSGPTLLSLSGSDSSGGFGGNFRVSVP
ncbi:MAG TPA: choice-of-anchor tandem repeat GloVer-containing protein [Chthonomonas sp.]|uniref:beta strand repeat-containing protein n=1 Tax=Chthonomonas sp. TaxID=2282153 RepID=UPI002B4B273A|nr:choice-of-anchor tandem repeat GloVer-containing protein [Chthonomonas sp.]HLI47146.1 choice-of-anchor tandem repeat GloVer-containing protein [Chthonomonas sp.]